MTSANTEQDLFRQSLRTMAVLVGACVLFVGTLSTAAVLITSKAMGGNAPAAAEVAPKDANAANGKKPLSI